MLEPRRGSSARVRVRTPPSLISPRRFARASVIPARRPEVTLFPRDREIRERGRGSLGDSRGPTSAHARVPAETRGCRSVPGRARGCAALGTRRHLRDPSPRPRKLTSKVGGNRVSTTRDSANRLGRRPAISEKPRQKSVLGADEEPKRSLAPRRRNRGASRICHGVRVITSTERARPRRSRTAPRVSGRRNTRSLEFRAARARKRTNDRARRFTKNPRLLPEANKSGFLLVI